MISLSVGVGPLLRTAVIHAVLGSLLVAACAQGRVVPAPSSDASGAGGVGAASGSGGAPDGAGGAPDGAGGAGPGDVDGAAGGARDAGVQLAPLEAGVATDGRSGAPDAIVIDPGSEGDGIFTITGPYKAAPEFSRQAGVPQGKLIRFTLATSAIYPKAMNRNVAVYVPAQHVSATPAPVMVVQDGTDFYGFDSSVPVVLDNLIAKGSIPAIVAVFAGNGGGDYIGSERGLEYDTVSGLYAQWADEELLPRVEQETRAQLPAQAVTFTKDPEGRATMGGSSGGAGSFSMAWWRPDLFRRVLTFSGTYVNQVAAGTPFPHGAWVYHDIDPYPANAPNGLIVASCESAAGPKTTGAVERCDTPLSRAACEAIASCRWNTSENKPLRVWLEAGSNDNGATGGPQTYRNFHLANQRMAAALKARGYHVHFDDAQGAGHVDSGPLRQTLPSALVWLWRGFRASRP